jgi:CheY-like chemotaxis protein
MSQPADDDPRSRLKGLKVLVVEDESIISFLIEDLATELGAAEVWHAASVAAALTLLAARRPDAAVLDVNLGGEPAHAVAERLEALGVPFVFATGYGRQGVPQWIGHPVLQKPFPIDALGEALHAVLGRQPRARCFQTEAYPAFVR